SFMLTCAVHQRNPRVAQAPAPSRPQRRTIVRRNSCDEGWTTRPEGTPPLPSTTGSTVRIPASDGGAAPLSVAATAVNKPLHAGQRPRWPPSFSAISTFLLQG